MLPLIPTAKVSKSPGSYSMDKTKNGKVTLKKGNVGRPVKTIKGQKL
jgi:hypothetical protein